MRDFDAILADALRLPPDERLDLALHLLDGLDGPADPDAEAAWGAEIERRLRDIDNGTTEMVSWDEVLRRLRGP